MNPFTVVIDSCVLYSYTQRDVLMCLAQAGLYRAKWTDQIHEEWIGNLLRNNPHLLRERLERTRALMNHHIRDSLVTGHESLIDGLTLPDPDDRHVLAAAIRSSATLILTHNLKDFPAEALSPFGIGAQVPDAFLLHQLTLDTARVLSTIKFQREGLQAPPFKSLAFLDMLARNGLPLFADELRRYADNI